MIVILQGFNVFCYLLYVLLLKTRFHLEIDNKPVSQGSERHVKFSFGRECGVSCAGSDTLPGSMPVLIVLSKQSYSFFFWKNVFFIENMCFL